MAKTKKIAAEATIKEVTLKPGNPGPGFIKVSFDGLEFSRSQEEQITRWMDEKEELRITLEAVQQNLLD